jgi:hypothetical protein
MKRAHLNLRARENAHQVSALLVTLVCLLGLIAQALLQGNEAGAGFTQVRPLPAAPTHRTGTLPELSGTKFDLMFGQPELALP